MKFLAVLITFTINHFWKRDRYALDDRWFFTFRDWLGRQMHRHSDFHGRSAWLFLALLLLLPSLLLWVLLWLLDGLLWGLPVFLIHLALLLTLFGHSNIAAVTARYLQSWRAANYESALHQLQLHRQQVALDNCDNHERLHQEFCRFLVADFFQRVFAVVFWYLLLGPAAALFYHLALQCRERVWSNASTEELELVARLVYLLEWLPARLLAATFTLAGDFVAAFSCLRDGIFDRDRSAESLVHSCALAAINADRKAVLVQESQISDAESPEQAVTAVVLEADEAIGEGAFRLRCARQVTEILELMQRSQIVWLTLLALLTLHEISV